MLFLYRHRILSIIRNSVVRITFALQCVITGYKL